MTPPATSSRRRWIGRVLLILAAACAIGGFFAFGLDRFVTLGSLRAYQQSLVALRDAHPVGAAALYFLAYVLATALSIPGALILTLAGGAIFGLVLGTVLVSFGATLGATLALLLARFVFRDLARRRLRARLDQINSGLARAGWVYLLTLRLVPAIPFVLVNLAFSLTAFPVRRFYWVSQLGMLPATIVYVNAGTQLERLQSLSGILSGPVVFSLLLLAALPWAGRMLSQRLLMRHATDPRP